MKSGLLLLLFSLLRYVVGQKEGNLDSSVSQFFTKPAETKTESRNPAPEGNTNLQPSTGGDLDSRISQNFTKPAGGGASVPGTGSCECVPYYLCHNNSITTDADGVIEITIIDDGPCDFLSVCCNPPDKLPEPITPPPNINKPKGCGVRNPDGIGFRINGDKDNEAQFGEFPWMVAVLSAEAVEGNAEKLLIYQCGASLIHPQVVMTSAHCVIGKDKQYKIRAGEWDTQTKNELFPHQDRDVKTIVIHPEYYEASLLNDVAILILDSPLEIAENVDSVCLPKQGELVENTRCFASGWGKDVFGKKGKYQVILQKIDLPVVPRDVCQGRLRTTRLGKHFKLHESFICAGGEEGKDTCKGDAGSPLVCPIPGHPGRYFQAGIVAWGIGCGENQVPGLYTNVAQFANWIDEQLATHNLEKSYYTI